MSSSMTSQGMSIKQKLARGMAWLRSRSFKQILLCLSLGLPTKPTVGKSTLRYSPEPGKQAGENPLPNKLYL